MDAADELLLQSEVTECATCAKTMNRASGAVVLCPSCLANRTLIERLQTRLREIVEAQEIAVAALKRVRTLTIPRTASAAYDAVRLTSDETE